MLVVLKCPSSNRVILKVIDLANKEYLLISKFIYP